MAHIFISYSRKDEAFARQLVGDLDRLGAEPWIDVDNIPAGMDWSDAVQQALDNCRLMIVVISPHSTVSRHVQDEWKYFMDQGKPLIPVLHQPTKLHFQLNRLHYIDFHAQDYATAFAQLHSELLRGGIQLTPLTGTILSIPVRAQEKSERKQNIAGIPRRYIVLGVISLLVVAISIALLAGGGGDGSIDSSPTFAAEMLVTPTNIEVAPTRAAYDVTMAPIQSAVDFEETATETSTPTQIPLPSPTPKGINPGDVKLSDGPSSLMLVIMLDDSSSMFMTNSANSAGRYGVAGRDPSDPLDGFGGGVTVGTRDEAVRTVLQLLASDPRQSHQVAIMQFSAGDAYQWISESQDMPFFSVGGPGYDPELELSHLFELVAKRLNSTGPGNPAGPSDIRVLLTIAEGELRSQSIQYMGKPSHTLRSQTNSARNQLKPAILLITDDVPMEFPWSPSNANPWLNPNTHIWTQYTEVLDENLNTLRGYLPSSNCSNTIHGEAGGVPIGVIALGVANWVGVDGSIAQGQHAEPYYRVLVSSLSDDDLYYPIDPMLEDQSDDLIAKFRNAGTDFVNTVRCNQVAHLAPDVSSSQLTIYKLNISDFHRMIRFVIDTEDDGSVPPEIMPADGDRTYTRYAPPYAASISYQYFGDGVSREIWTFLQQADWAGEWTITFPGETQISQLAVETEIQIGDLVAVPDKDSYLIINNDDAFFAARLATGGLPVDPVTDPLIDHIETIIAGETFPVILDQERLIIAYSSDTPPLPGFYDWHVIIYFNPHYFEAPPVRVSIPSVIQFDETFTRGDIAPANGTVWNCEYLDSGEYGQLFEVQLIKPVHFVDNSVLSTIEIQVFDENPSENPEIAPVRRLVWNNNGSDTATFEGVIPCDYLKPSGNEETIWIKAEFADNSPVFELFAWDYTLSPTSTPVPTPTINPTSTVELTPDN